jgi:hypothetical protein
LTAESTIQSTPIQIISKDIQVLSSHPPNTTQYEKTEKVIYWINSRKTKANDMSGNTMECLQYQLSEVLNKSANWKVLCDDIINFDYKEGTYYKIQVLKKWLKNHENLMDRTPYDFELIKVVSKEKDENYINPIKTIITTNKEVYSIDEPIILSLEVKNTDKKPYTFLPWGTPLEKRLTKNCIQITHNGTPIPYIGILVKRIPPTEKDYVTLTINESLTGEINLQNDYKLTEKGTYKIQFKETYKGLPASNTVTINVK